MSIARTAILLFAYPAGKNLSLRSKQWYENYFFNQASGLAAYWNKQTDNRLNLHGLVFDWVLVDELNPDLRKRQVVIENAISYFENERDINFDRFDIIITVIASPPNVHTDGGAVEVSSDNRKHTGIALPINSRFDFIAHEIGHGLNLQHSFGDPSYKNASWSAFGEYGHPHTVS